MCINIIKLSKNVKIAGKLIWQPYAIGTCIVSYKYLFIIMIISTFI